MYKHKQEMKENKSTQWLLKIDFGFDFAFYFKTFPDGLKRKLILYFLYS